MQGSPADLSRSGVDFAKLVGTEENEENSEKFGRQLSRRSSTRSASSASLSSDGSEIDDEEDQNEDQKGLEMESSSKGKVKGSVTAGYFKAGAHWSILFVLGISFLVVQMLASAADYWVSVW